ncbi:DinB family protein [Galbibacter mesophilus]|uniref:DinB family protein n=1 Tax=Galbibacter mesophilus TaxID=379069 RepID=UPI00191F552B|nr:DinB family protein [Galbibacter mesophilus]MCM5663996.1 DinB family protein [Galbibacter mesophilus]
MSFLQDILNELKQEGAVTRRHLEKVDFKSVDFQPHEKSEKLGRLAIHVAEIIAWWKNVLENSDLNFIDFEPREIKTTEELLNYFDGLFSEAKNAIENADEAELSKNWSMKYGDDILFTLNKKEVLRKFCLNHLIHHRAQLGVYLRMLDIPVPAVYGPSADDENITLIEKFN